jgi:hypothetical protein
MTKYVVFWDAGLCGTEHNSGIVEYDTEWEAIQDHWGEAVEWAQNWQEEDQSDEELEEQVSIWAEEYDPEKHDGVL